MDKLTPQEIFEQFETGQLKSWHHYEHVVIALNYAQNSASVAELYLKTFCAFLRFTTFRDGPDVNKCITCFNSTITLFWSTKIFELVQENKDKTVNELLLLADGKAYLNKELIYQYYRREDLHSAEYQAFPVPLKK